MSGDRQAQRSTPGVLRLHGARLEGSGRPQLLAWIIEYVWTHRTLDVQEVMDPAHWPAVDSQPLSLADATRLRVASAQVYCIVKSRDVQHFERAMGFVEATYRLLPGLETPLKHMKIMFGLKTMVVMWMLRSGRGMVDTVCKIITFFPSQLPQYQDRCTQYDMFLMRKNHLDFKTLAQALALDKDKRNDYMMKHLDEQYGERYAQKVEDRLLQYLHKLEAALKGDTYIDKILKKSSPATEEEKLLLELVTCDSITIATTLKKLLHCDFPCCRQARIPGSSGNGDTEIESSSLSKPLNSSKAALLEASAQDGAKHQRILEVGDVVNKVEEKSSTTGVEVCQGSRRPATPPHFCSRHQRWVKSILQQCPDECSEELLLQANLSLSPPLFPSSSSTSSSQDLTPSDLLPSPPDQPPLSQTSEEKHASSPSQKEAVPQPPLPGDVFLPALSPVVRLIDVASTVKSCQPSANDSVVSSNKTTHISTNKDSVFNLPESVQLPDLTSSCQPTTPQPFSRLSRKYRQTCATTRHLRALGGFSPNPSDETTSKAQTTCPVNRPRSLADGSLPGSSACAADLISSSARLAKPVCRPEAHSTSSAPLLTPQPTAVGTDRPPLRHDGEASTALTRPLLPRQVVLLRPYVNMTRLSSEECCRMTKGRCCSQDPVATGRREEEDDADSSFDPNTLYSSHSSGSDGEDLANDDPDYRPCIKKKRLLLEYEAARSLKHVQIA